MWRRWTHEIRSGPNLDKSIEALKFEEPVILRLHLHIRKGTSEMASTSGMQAAESAIRSHTWMYPNNFNSAEHPVTVYPWFECLDPFRTVCYAKKTQLSLVMSGACGCVRFMAEAFIVQYICLLACVEFLTLGCGVHDCCSKTRCTVCFGYGRTEFSVVLLIQTSKRRGTPPPPFDANFWQFSATRTFN